MYTITDYQSAKGIDMPSNYKDESGMVWSRGFDTTIGAKSMLRKIACWVRGIEPENELKDFLLKCRRYNIEPRRMPRASRRDQHDQHVYEFIAYIEESNHNEHVVDWEGYNLDAFRQGNTMTIVSNVDVGQGGDMTVFTIHEVTHEMQHGYVVRTDYPFYRMYQIQDWGD